MLSVSTFESPFARAAAQLPGLVQPVQLDPSGSAAPGFCLCMCTDGVSQALGASTSPCLCLCTGAPASSASFCLCNPTEVPAAPRVEASAQSMGFCLCMCTVQN